MVLDCSVSEGSGFAVVTCNSTFGPSVRPDCEITGINGNFIVPCEIT